MITYHIFNPNNISYDEHKLAILARLNSYQSVNGNLLPTAKKINEVAKSLPGIFPPIKTIQRHGGLRNFYENILGLVYIDGRSGEYRSDVARSINDRSIKISEPFTRKLIGLFGEVNVHIEEPYPNSVARTDYTIYLKSGRKLYIDVFYPMDMHSLGGCIRLKANKLAKSFKEETYFVSMNEIGISTDSIEQFMYAKKSAFPDNIKVLTVSAMLAKLSTIK